MQHDYTQKTRKYDLSEVDFAHRDIRGMNFSGSNLTGVSFAHAKAGLPVRWSVILMSVVLFTVFLSGFTSTIAGFIATYWITFEAIHTYTIVPAGIMMSLLTIFFITTFWRGSGAGFASVAVTGAFALAITVSLAGIIPVAGTWAAVIPLSGAGAFGSIAWIGSIAVSVAVAWSITSSLGIVLILATWCSALTMATCWPVARIGAVSTIKAMGVIGGEGIWTLAILGAGLMAIIGSYVGWRAILGEPRFIFIRELSIALATIGGTKFQCANLTDADFSYAKLENTNFRGALLTRTRWLKAENLSLASLGKSYLAHQQIRSLVLTCRGQGKSFEGLSLRGVNLSEAELKNANFINCDFSEATLQGADLSSAKLVQTQLDKTNLTNAHLTGAYIENWGITAETKLDNVDCKYVFMRLPTQENPEPYRKPDNRQEEFQPGDFADFIRPIVDTLDLYHNGTVDPRAIAISFKQLAENNPDANLEIVAMERRGNNKLLIRAKTSKEANFSQLNAEYFSTYNYFIALPPHAQAQLLAEKDNRIQSLEAMVTTALQRPSFYTENNIHKVNTMHNNPGGISQSISGSNIYGGLQASQGDNNQLTMNTSVDSSPEEKQLTQSEVIQLLAQIKAMINQAELPSEIKEESALYLGAAMKATEREEPKKALAAENLKSMVETVQTASKTVESSKSLWENMKPLLIQLPAWLGVARGFFGF